MQDDDIARNVLLCKAPIFTIHTLLYHLTRQLLRVLEVSESDDLSQFFAWMVVLGFPLALVHGGNETLETGATGGLVWVDAECEVAGDLVLEKGAEGGSDVPNGQIRIWFGRVYGVKA